MASSGINFSGLASGIDTDSLIQKLVTIAKQPGVQYTNAQKALNKQIQAYQTINAKLYGLQSASGSLNSLSAFQAVTSTSSATDNITVSTDSGAQTGTYNVTVNNIAASQQISSSPQANTTDPLGYTGQIVINGKTIQVTATDTLTTLASNINNAGAGVSAGIVTPSAGQNFLTLSSTTTGVKGKIQISDTAGGTFLSGKLGIINASSTSITNPVGTNGAGSSVFTNSGTSIGTLLGLTPPPAGNIQINGTSVAIDYATDTLSTIANKITSKSIAGVSATVVTTTDPRTGKSGQQLQITGASGQPLQFTDSNNLLTNLGVLGNSLQTGRELSAAQDASFTVNGLTATRSSNTVSDLISGVTLNLLQGGGKASTITIGRDTAGIKSKIQSFVSSYNDILNTVGSYTSFDSGTNTAGPLLGDSAAQSLVDNLISGVSSKIPGLDSKATVKLLSDIGLTIDTTGQLNIDDGKLTTALSSGNITDIANLFKTNGTSSSSQLAFVSATDQTQVSGDGQYSVKITRAATQATVTAGFALKGTLASDETLTFGGSLFGTTVPSDAKASLSGKTVSLKAGSSLSDIVSTINGSDVTKDLVTASIVDGKLSITSKGYGSTTQFAVQSGVADDTTGQRSSGIGSTFRSVSGVDVAGQIGVLLAGRAGTSDSDYTWETASGSGQILTGSQTAFGQQQLNGKALGLKLRVTSLPSDVPASGSLTVGTLKFTRGVADSVYNYTNLQNDSTRGSLASAVTSLQSQVDFYDTEIKDLNTSVTQYQTDLKKKYATLETSVSKIKSAQASLAKLG